MHCVLIIRGGVLVWMTEGALCIEWSLEGGC